MSVPDHDWQLAQGAVDFRNEERRHRDQVRREESPRSATPIASEPGFTAPPAEHLLICPNCLTDLDDSGYCDGCSYLATIRRPA